MYFLKIFVFFFNGQVLMSNLLKGLFTVLSENGSLTHKEHYQRSDLIFLSIF